MKMGQEQFRQQLFLAMAEEIGAIRQLLQNLETVLVSDEDVILKHYQDLQHFDLIIQHVEESAKLLHRLAEGTCSHEAIENVRLARLKGVFQAAVQG